VPAPRGESNAFGFWSFGPRHGAGDPLVLFGCGKTASHRRTAHGRLPPRSPSTSEVCGPIDFWHPLVRDAARGALRRPGSSLLVVLALALGIGATTSMFSVVDAVLFRPLQAERPKELVRMVATDESHADYWNHSFPVTGVRPWRVDPVRPRAEA